MMKGLLCLLMICCIINGSAQTIDQPIILKNISINIKTGCFTAVTHLDMEFYNPNPKVLDGQFDFSLQAEQIITGFALDINGFMREGVIVDKQKARIAYENTIRRRIDPGLIEMVTDNNYRLRIYPMPANGTRKVRILISQMLKVESFLLRYDLPFDSVKVSNMDVTVRTHNRYPIPTINAGLLQKQQFVAIKDSFVLRMTEKDLLLNTPISFSIPVNNDEVCYSKKGNETRFAIRTGPSIANAVAPDINSLTVYWDASGSAIKRNLDKELEFLDKYCQERKVNELAIIVFGNEIRDLKRYTIKSGLNKQVIGYLKNLDYDGGTRFDRFDKYEFSGDAALLFSDGIKNFGSFNIQTDGKPLHCVNSSSTANHQLLQEISGKNAGRYYDLSRLTVSEAINLSGKVQNKLLKLKSGEETISLTNDYPVSFDNWLTISGELKNQHDQVTLYYGDLGKVEHTDFISLSSTTDCDPAELDLILTLHKYQRCLNSKNESSISDLAKSAKIVSASTSFIVLDNLSDYIEHGIEPPSDLRDEYNKQLLVVQQLEKSKKMAEENAVINNLQNSVALYNQRINWWGKDEKIIALNLNPVQKNKSTEGGVAATNNPVVQAPDMDNATSSLQEVVVTGYASQRRMSMTGSVTIVNSESISGSGANMLQGRIAGLSIQANPAGDRSNIVIRGVSSLREGNEPLIVIDGVISDNHQMNLLHPNNIYTVTVLKNNEASALYGSRASQGAIVIVTKNAGNDYRFRQGQTGKYEDMADVDYVTEIKTVKKFERYSRYLVLKENHASDPAFFIDMSQLMMEAGEKEMAVRILTNLLEIDGENHQLLRAVGYTLENWRLYEDAIEVYKKVLEIKEEEPQSYRDLALAYEKSGQYQKAVDILYQALTKNWYQYENRYRGMKSLLLNEMNSIINRHETELDLSIIRPEIIRPLPVDLRVVIDWNKDETDMDLHIIEPGGETCYYGNRNTKSGGRMSEDFTQGYGPEEYQIKEKKDGKYKIMVNYYGDRYQKAQTPTVLRLTIYRNFGRPDQTISTQTLVMNNQSGIIEIATVK